MSETKLFTRKEIVGRNTKSDAVFVIDNLVYDVTKFLDDHPGGHEVLLNVAGKDASEDFHDVGHSIDAKDMMKKYRIGEVVEEDRVVVKKKDIKWSEPGSESGESFMTTWKFPILLGLIMSVLYTYLFGL